MTYTDATYKGNIIDVNGNKIKFVVNRKREIWYHVIQHDRDFKVLEESVKFCLEHDCE